MKKKVLLKLLVSVLAIVLLASAFVSCNADIENGEDTNAVSEESSAESTEASATVGALTLVLDGKAKYKIIRPDECDEYITAQANEIRKYIRDKTRANVNVVSDGGATQKNTSEYEILIGKTNRAESIEAYKRLDYNGSKAFISGNKIVLAAHNSETMSEAVTALTKQMRSQKGENTLTVAKLNVTKSGTYAIKKLTFGSDELWNFGIVAEGDGVLALANNIRSLVGAASGVVLDIYSSAQELPAGIKPLFIGGTVSPDGTENTYYRLGAANGGVALYCSDARARTEAYIDFQTALSVEAADAIDLLSVISPKQRQESGNAESADLKIMTFNVLNGWNTSNIGTRDDVTAQEILEFMPDVLGLQEFDDYYRNATGTPLTSLISEKYAEVAESVNSWNPIFYNKDTIELITRGHEDYTEGTSYPTYSYQGAVGSKFRTINWALFEHKASGKQFLVFNTHLDVEANMQPSQVTELKNKISEIKTMFGLDNVFLIGDLNSNIGSQTAQSLFSFGFKDTHELAVTKDNLGSSATQGTAVTGSYSSAIDHVYCIGENITVSDYKTVTDIRAVSDHCPICVTLTIN